VAESDLIPYFASSVIGTPPSLVLAPHPDDEVLGCGGVIFAHRQAGNPVDVIVVTDGRLGVADGSLSDNDAKNLRSHESEQAAILLDYGTPLFWGYPDRGLVCDTELIERLCDVVRVGGYNSVFVPSPFEIHPDHKALAMAMISVARHCRLQFELCFYEVGVPLFPNRLLDISEFFERKREAIRCFSSQLSVQDYLEQCEGLNRFRTYTLPQTVRYAEAFCVLRSSELPAYAFEPTSIPPFCRSDIDMPIRWLCESSDRTDAPAQLKTVEFGESTRSVCGTLHKQLKRLLSAIVRQ
jgi:LmbE family N-acetylglucosaminyl deacetylase